MKILLSLFVLFTFTLSARAEEDYCKGKETCRIGYIPLLSSGTYYAKGEGQTCQEAKDNSRDVFMYEFGDMDCGRIAGPFVWGCNKIDENHFTAWTRCNPDSGSNSEVKPSRCVIIAGVPVCNR